MLSWILFISTNAPLSDSDSSALIRASLVVLIVVILAAKLGGETLGRLGQPPVLGELVVGVVLGNLNLVGITWLDPLKTNGTLALIGSMGAILLLFEVGVESDLRQLLAVGWSSLLVATFGVIAPFILGVLVSSELVPGAGWLTHLFVGGTLTATSVGITARVLKDLRKSDTKEARIILGAAVADDVIGLIVLAIVSGLVTAAMKKSGAASIDWLSSVWILVKASLFLTLAIVIGRFWSQRVFNYAVRMRIPGMLLAICISFCFLVSLLAQLVGLAPIVGAFAAGVVLEEVHYRPFLDRGERPLSELLFPINTLIVPVFFVLMGLRVDLREFASPVVLGFAALITVAAVLGKQVCGLGVLERGVDRVAIGVGMIPRGEVGLIFAGMGATLMLNGRPVLSRAIYAALVLMIVVTTFITPPLLKIALNRKGRSGIVKSAEDVSAADNATVVNADL